MFRTTIDEKRQRKRTNAGSHSNKWNNTIAISVWKYHSNKTEPRVSCEGR